MKNKRIWSDEFISIGKCFQLKCLTELNNEKSAFRHIHPGEGEGAP